VRKAEAFEEGKTVNSIAGCLAAELGISSCTKMGQFVTNLPLNHSQLIN